MHFFIHNSLHAGDVILTRPFITALKDKYPELEITLECRSTYRYLWEDLGLPIVDYEGADHLITKPTPNCPSEMFFLNMWFGIYQDIAIAFGLTFSNSVYTFNRLMKEYQLDNIYRLTIPPCPPAIKFYRKPEIPMTIHDNAVLIENGKPRSKQNFFPINDYLKHIANTYPQYTFYCSAKPPCNLLNLVDCSKLDLLQLSELSNHCRALITLGSGVNAATYTEENRFKPRCFAGMAFYMQIWDDIHNPVFQAKDINGILKFLDMITQNKKIESPNLESGGFNPGQMCKFLRHKSEIDVCTRYLYENDYISHIQACKNWEMAHILEDLGDGNLLDMGSTDSYILKNAVRKKTKGAKYGIDHRTPDQPENEVTYLVGDLLEVPLPDRFFKYITCLSVIEHEVDFENFAAESSRLLDYGGKLYITFDYLAPKTITALKIYDRKWQPLDDFDVQFLKCACEANGLRLVQDIDWSLGEKVIHWGYFSPHPQIAYTFGMLVFKK
jgi:SAM-dependent methyltransferase